MSVKDGMPFLRDTLASLEAQSYRNFELLVWLVESSDGTADELARWIPSRIPGRIFRSGPLGLGAARRNLVEHALSEYCACIDADDLNEPERLEKQVSFLDANPGVALVGSRMRIIDGAGILTGEVFNYPLDPECIVDTFLAMNAIGQPTVVFRRDAVLSVGNYNPNARIEDYDLWLRLGRHHRIANLPEYLVRYRIQARSHTRRWGLSRVDGLAAETMAEIAPDLFGLGGETALAFRERRLRLAAWTALKVARHLAKARGVTTSACMRRPSLLESFRALTRDGDWISFLFYDYFDPRPRAFREALHEFRNSLISRFSLGRRLLAAVRRRRGKGVGDGEPRPR